MKELNKALSYRLAEDICNYLEYLRKYHGYSIVRYPGNGPLALRILDIFFLSAWCVFP